MTPQQPVIPQAEVDAGAEALRDRLLGTRDRKFWYEMQNVEKTKWRNHARCVLTAAAMVRECGK
jgi:exonuclease I